MVRQIFSSITFLIFLSSCSTFKPLNFTDNRQTLTQAAPSPQAKFIDDIILTAQVTVDKAEVKPEPQTSFVTTRAITIVESQIERQAEDQLIQIFASRNSEIEAANSVQLKYAVLMKTEVESLPSKILLENVDEWYGVRYRTGGNTKSGVDCSGFTVAVYTAVYGFTLPRVSREQYRTSRKISTTELQEGDLVFFNTNGRGVSHVGVYLGNNKFIHASVSKGVMVNDLFEPYYLKRYYGAGRFDDKQAAGSN